LGKPEIRKNFNPKTTHPRNAENPKSQDFRDIQTHRRVTTASLESPALAIPEVRILKSETAPKVEDACKPEIQKRKKTSRMHSEQIKS
jgi:hypothetical protein